jgi:3-hydroxypropanoate dehydrogenase
MTIQTDTARVLGKLDDAGRAALFTEARTANTFAPTPVSDAELSQIWELAKWAPTAANTQPLRVLYVRTEAGRDRLVRHMNDGNKAKTASAPAVAVLAMDTRFHDHIPTLLPFRPEMKDVFDAAGMDAEFFPDGRWGSILVINIGHPGPDPWFERLPRLAHEDTLRWA